MAVSAMALTLVASCGTKMTEEPAFIHTIDKFADVSVLRYQVPGWESLSLRQKEYAFHLAEAAKYGNEIHIAQNCRHNLELRDALVAILEGYKGDRECDEYKKFEEYAKRFFFSAGIHHHYAEDKFFPACSKDYFSGLLTEMGMADKIDLLIPYCYDPAIFPQRRSTATDGDIVALSGVDFYEGVTREEVEKYYASIEVPGDPQPVSYGLNTKIVKEDGKVVEKKWMSGGIYGPAIDNVCRELELAAAVAENEFQKDALSHLITYYRTGDLREWDAFNIIWVKDTEGTVDFVNGFVEDYNDPLGRKGAWEGHVNLKDAEASGRTVKMAANAQWFEDNAPISREFKKSSVKGVSAKVINAVCLSGDAYPATPIGINLPNADWIRKDYGSKSVTIANITHAYDAAALENPKSTLTEFAWDEKEIELCRKYGSIASEVHTDLHECLGHGSGQLLPGVSSSAMGEFSSTLEETRADLFGLYFAADPKLVELGILPDPEAYKAEYCSYIRNALMVQFNRIELGRPNTEAHMQNRKLIGEWCYEKGLENNVIEKKVRDGKTYFVINDFDALRALFGDLLAEIQRIKSTGDYAAGKALVEKYAINIDPDLHKEVKQRYESLGLKPYSGFINPDIVPIEKGGQIVDYEIRYCDNFLEQMLEYARDYSVL